MSPSSDNKKSPSRIIQTLTDLLKATESILRLTLFVLDRGVLVMELLPTYGKPFLVG